MNSDSLLWKSIKIVNRLLSGVPKRMCRFAIQHSLVDYEYSEREMFFRRAFKALSFNGINGDYLEFGCWGCTTFSLAYKQSLKYGMHIHLWAFDSFCGLPPKEKPEDNHPLWQEGAMAMSAEAFRGKCIKVGIPASKFSIVAGFYKQTLNAGSERNLPRDICLAYIDCDLYSSTLTVLEFLTARLKHGMIIAFDDYYCWSPTAISGERKACSDYFRNSKEWILVPYVQFGWHGMSFVVERRNLGGASLTTY